MGTAQAASVIDAPIDLVWAVMLDTDRYPEWNPFVVRIDLPHEREMQVGDPVVLHVRWLTGGRTTLVGAGHEDASRPRLTTAGGRSSSTSTTAPSTARA